MEDDSNDRPPPEVGGLVEAGDRRIENALRTKPLEMREKYARHFKALRAAYGAAMLELRTRKKMHSMLCENKR